MTDSTLNYILAEASQKVQNRRAQVGKFTPEDRHTPNLGPRDERKLLLFADGSAYLGEWLKNTDIRHGWGVLVGPGGTDLYEGYWMYN